MSAHLLPGEGEPPFRPLASGPILLDHASGNWDMDAHYLPNDLRELSWHTTVCLTGLSCLVHAARGSAGPDAVPVFEDVLRGLARGSERLAEVQRGDGLATGGRLVSVAGCPAHSFTQGALLLTRWVLDGVRYSAGDADPASMAAAWPAVHGEYVELCAWGVLHELVVLVQEELERTRRSRGRARETGETALPVDPAPAAPESHGGPSRAVEEALQAIVRVLAKADGTLSLEKLMNAAALPRERKTRKPTRTVWQALKLGRDRGLIGHTDKVGYYVLPAGRQALAGGCLGVWVSRTG